MIRAFKIIAFLEGTSLLLLILVTMPLKYILHQGQPNQVVGMAHGFLFLAYVVLALMLKPQLSWNYRTLGIVLLCSIIPGGTFWMERNYLKEV